LCQVQRIAEGIQPPPRIIDLNPQNLEEVLLDVERVGAELGQPAAGLAAADALRTRVAAAVAAAAAAGGGGGGDAARAARPSVAFVEWVAPIFVGGHWTPQLIHMAGGAHPLNPLLE
jgi:ABC-type Fe3+-hydroxamate transport system substrate-binding protein